MDTCWVIVCRLSSNLEILFGREEKSIESLEKSRSFWGCLGGWSFAFLRLEIKKDHRDWSLPSFTSRWKFWARTRPNICRLACSMIEEYLDMPVETTHNLVRCLSSCLCACVTDSRYFHCPAISISNLRLHIERQSFCNEHAIDDILVNSKRIDQEYLRTIRRQRYGGYAECLQ